MRLILASKSPRRKMLMEKAGLVFDVIPSGLEEKSDQTNPEELVRELAAQKAGDVASREKGIIIGADTIVVLDSRIMGKPTDMENARDMLKSLSGKVHRVYTGICVINTEKGREITDFCRSDVKFRELTDSDITEYFSRHNPLDKAGGYAVQEGGEMIIDNVDGSYTNVVGLPMEKLEPMLKEAEA